MKRILFVCTGNTCRSPMAEAILKQKLKWAGIRGVAVSSAGIQAEEGEKMSPNAFLALKQLGIVNYAFRSRRLTEKMMARSDLVIVMTERQRDLLCDWPSVGTRLQRIAAKNDGGIMKVAIACDHGGYLLKPVLTDYLEKNKIEYVDFGTDGTQSVDYPDYALPAAECVARGECDFGILICGTGIGMSIAANKVNGIRFGARVIGAGLMLEIVDAFLHASFDGGRHVARIEKIRGIERKYRGEYR